MLRRVLGLALVGYAVSVKSDETSTPTDISAIAARQHGTLVCIWGGTTGAGELAGYAEQLEIDIAVDAKAAYEKDTPAIDADDPPTQVNTAGDKSGSSCDVEDFFYCGGEMLVGNYWVSAALRNENVSTVSAAVAAARIQRVLTTVAAELAGTKPGSAWHHPASTLPTLCSAPGSRVALQHALGVPRLQSTPFVLTAINSFYLSEPGADSATCQWRTASYKALVNSPHTDIVFGAYRAVQVPGSRAVVLSCSISFCVAILTERANVVQIGLEPVLSKKFKGPSQRRTIQVLAALVTDLESSHAG
jgi:hypothetical protein